MEKRSLTLDRFIFGGPENLIQQLSDAPLIQNVGKRGKVYGFIKQFRGELVYVKAISREIHFYRKLQTFAIDEDIVKGLAEIGVKKVYIPYVGAKTHVYVSQLKQWLNSPFKVFYEEEGEWQIHVKVKDMVDIC